MANKKNKVSFLCSACGDDFPKWHGQCPSCKEWGTLSEFKTLGRTKSSKTEFREYKPLLDTNPIDFTDFATVSKIYKICKIYKIIIKIAKQITTNPRAKIASVLSIISFS